MELIIKAIRLDIINLVDYKNRIIKTAPKSAEPSRRETGKTVQLDISL